MFTGLIEEVGRLKAVKRQGEALVLTVGAATVLEDVRAGDSIAVNGVCLTVVSYDRQSFTVDVMPETFRLTTLHSLQPGAPLNLERAMPAGGRFGGHIVQGHVDGTATIRGRTEQDNAVVFAVEPDRPELLKYFVPQGSVTLDGISLTVVEVRPEQGHFIVSIIPHTLKETALQAKRTGDRLNVECDILGKYIDHFLHLRSGGSAGGAGSGFGRGGLTEALLRENGFM